MVKEYDAIILKEGLEKILVYQLLISGKLKEGTRTKETEARSAMRRIRSITFADAAEMVRRPYLNDASEHPPSGYPASRLLTGVPGFAGG
jgi:hypothetical protein